MRLEYNAEMHRILSLFKIQSAWRIAKQRSRVHELEMGKVVQYCNTRKSVIDIGAADGNYTFLLAPFAKKVYAFEPQPKFAKQLQKVSKHFFSNVEVIRTALSDSLGERDFFHDLENPGLSRLSDAAQSVPHKNALTVTARTLDSYGIQDISLIKIDVEGHELEVVKGAQATLLRERPVLLIESESRHRKGCPQSLFDLMNNLNYQGFFFVKDEMRSIREFDLDEHQQFNNLESRNALAHRTTYVNNFLFIPT
jgi:FkbM family methyltransferase